jgi:hypothetical protein
VDEKQLQSHPEPLTQALELEQLQIDDSLLMQVLGLDLDQMALLAKVGGRRLRQFGIVPGRLGGKGCGRRIEGRRALRGGSFGSGLAFRSQNSCHTARFGHGLPSLDAS